MKQRSGICLLFLTVFFIACKKEVISDGGPGIDPIPVVTAPTDNDHLLPGNPTNADSDPAHSENYFINQIFYKEAYSASRGIPVWVGWHLESGDVGSAPRQDDFRADDKLPATFYRVLTSHYTNTGFDRGHNCPSADRTSSITANSSTFLMTNITPQAPNLNRGPWEGLEDYIRNTLVGGSNEAWIIMGSFGSGGTGSNGTANSFNNGRITVPKKIWKVVLLIPKGSNDLARIDTSARVLVVSMPNVNTYTSTTAGKAAWRNYLTTINNLEQEAHIDGINLDFFTNISVSTRTYLKGKTF